MMKPCHPEILHKIITCNCREKHKQQQGPIGWQIKLQQTHKGHRKHRQGYMGATIDVKIKQRLYALHLTKISIVLIRRSIG